MVLLFVGRIFGQEFKTKQKDTPNKEARTNAKQISDLKIGDEIPDVAISLLQNEKIVKMKIKDLKQPLIILDFWDTYCTSCITAFPRLDSLQKKFKNSLLILPVTYQDQKLVSNFLKNNRFLKKNNINLVSAVDDKILKEYFKHQGVPHEVWIYKGKVKAITAADYINEKNIEKILLGKNVNWPVKHVLNDFNYNEPLLNSQSIQRKQGFPIYAAIFKYIEGVESKSGYVLDSINHTIRQYFINQPIIQLYYSAMSLKTPFPFFTAPNRMILEVKDSNYYVFDSNKNYKARWDIDHAFSYESVFPDSISKSRRSDIIVEQLNGFLGLKGRIETRKVKCLILTKEKSHNVESDTSSFFHKKPIKELIRWLDTTNQISGQYLPIVDETRYSGLISLGEWTDLDTLRNELHKRGFDIRAGERNVDLFVLSETNNK